MVHRASVSIGLAAFALGVLLAGCNTAGSSAVGSSMGANVPSSVPAKKTGKNYYYPPELWNGFVTPPSPSGPAPMDFEIIFTGNVTADFPNPLEPGYGGYDPFCPPNQTCTNITVTYNPSTNTTTVEFSAIPPYYLLYPNISGHGNEVHFGILNGPGGTRVKCLQWYTEWTFASAPPQVTPVLNVCNPKKVKTKAAATGTAVFATVFIAESFSPITASQAATAGTWIDVPYIPPCFRCKAATQPKFEFTNPTSQTIYTANSGIVLDQSYPTDPECIQDLYCDENIANLELLNYADMPPPGSASSPFITMQFPPARMIPPGK